MGIVPSIVIVKLLSICLLHPVISKKGDLIHNGGRVIGGGYTTIDSFPFVVKINRLTFSGHPIHTCGGSILTTSVILTACHCIAVSGHADLSAGLVSPNEFRVIAGITSANQVGQERRARAVEAHPQCRKVRNGEENDVGVIILQAPLQLSPTVQFLQVFSGNVRQTMAEFNRLMAAGTECYNVGWGYTRYPPPTYDNPSTLKFSRLTYQADEQCRKSYCSVNQFFTCDYSFIQHNQFCMVDPAGSPCYGDSGGPLVCNGLVFGVFQLTSCTAGYPIILSNANAFYYFIDKYGAPW